MQAATLSNITVTVVAHESEIYLIMLINERIKSFLTLSVYK